MPDFNLEATMAVQWMDPQDFGAMVRALGEELLKDGTPEARAQIERLCEAFTKPETPPPGAGPGGTTL